MKKKIHHKRKKESNVKPASSSSDVGKPLTHWQSHCSQKPWGQHQHLRHYHSPRCSLYCPPRSAPQMALALAREPQRMLSSFSYPGHLYHNLTQPDLLFLILELSILSSLWLEKGVSEKDKDHNIRTCGIK
ncbi:hypothetical protein LOK49_LG01G01309 [Camellia lanceoleosa]|uniref:Uncharacterized protein n=1 Tax=Camellia lanceoleosa TaxID=1840588 RepID=A0ACC0IX00_9ERIC|nr:hypothetical protein LOK49_LG01G01309 [Camellia lanceoleosa]